MPGSSHGFPDGSVCDRHPDRESKYRIQGETDSFGAEYYDMCEECHTKYIAEIKDADTSGMCDWCKQYSPVLRLRRDFEEGMSGPIYNVCPECIRKENERLAEELDEYDDYY